MKIGGFQKFSLIDYPGKTAAIIFTSGCNFRCRYCHNPELVRPKLNALRPRTEYKTAKILSFLKKRQGKLDAVSITGGEPTLQQDLKKFISLIRELGYSVKLDSNGTNPQMLKQIIKKNLVDYLAMDIKAPLSKYQEIIRVKTDLKKIKDSINLILGSGLNHEFRTTIVQSLTTKEDLRQIAQTIQGAQNYYLQQFIPSKTLDPAMMNEQSYSKKELEELALSLKKFVQNCQVR